MTRQAHVLLFVLTIFISSLPRERYSVTSCGVLPFQCNPPCLILSTTDIINSRIVALDYDNLTSYQIITGLSRAVAVDVHFTLGYLFWSDITEKNIKRSCIDGTNMKIINDNVEVCDGLAVEWKSSQLYWTDTTNSTISVSDLEGNNIRILVSASLDKPRGIALDPEQGSMFWTDWGATPKIEKSTLTGTQRVTLVTSNLQWPNGITIDRQNKLVFWVDAGKDRLESIDYHGNNRTLLYQQAGLHPFGVTFLSPYLFVSEWITKGVYKLNASSGVVSGNAFFSGVDKLMGLVPYDSSWQLPVSTCPPLPAPSNGTRLGCPGNATMYYDTVCQFSCNDGYIGSGSQVRRCQRNGTWGGQDFICQIINCTSLTIDPAGPLRMSSCDYHYGAQCRFSCATGYRLNGSSTVTCVALGNQRPGMWNSTIPTCEAITCPSMPAPSNGTRLGCPENATMYYNTVCQLSCNDGYVGSGSQVRRCQPNGTWSGQDFTCHVDGCKNYKVLNGVDRAQGYTLPAQQRCDSGLELGWYRFQGLAGDQMADTCVSMLRCGTVAPGWLSGLHPTVADGVVLRKICYNWLSCCHHSDHIQVRNCGAFFVYELKKPPSCNLRYCGNGRADYMCSALPAPPNGIKFGCPENAIVYNDTACQFSCDDGYIGSGSQQRRCQPNGTWSGQDFACQIINCTSLTIDPAGPLRMSSCDNHYGAQCNFSCAIGYRLNGSSTVTCVAPGNQHRGVWNNTIPTCEAITCQALPAPSNGARLGCPGNATMYYNTVCQFSCNDGYIGSGSQVRRCQCNGTWSGQDFTCKIVTCPMLSAPINGELLGCNTTLEMLYNTVCRFSCDEGSEAFGSMIRRCTENGTWSGTNPVCTAVTCPRLSPPSNGELLGCNTTEMLYKTVCGFSCNEGFEAKGSVVRRCTENGTWSGTDLVCDEGIHANAGFNIKTSRS